MNWLKKIVRIKETSTQFRIYISIITYFHLLTAINCFICALFNPLIATPVFIISAIFAILALLVRFDRRENRTIVTVIGSCAICISISLGLAIRLHFWNVVWLYGAEIPISLLYVYLCRKFVR